MNFLDSVLWTLRLGPEPAMAWTVWRVDKAYRERRWHDVVRLCEETRFLACGPAGPAVMTLEKLAVALRNLGRFDEADATLAAAFAFHPDRPALIRLRRASAEVAMARTDWSEAALRWKVAFDTDQDEYSRIRLARALVAVRRFDEADALLRQGHEAKPNHVGLLSSRAELAMRQREWEQAAVLYARVLKELGDGASLNVFVQANLAERHLGRTDAAERILNRGVARHANQVSLWHGGDRLEPVTVATMQADTPQVSVRLMASSMLGAQRVLDVQTQSLRGGLGNNGCFIHTLTCDLGDGPEGIRVFEKWPINTKVRGQTLQEANFYVCVFPSLDARRRALVPRPWFIGNFGPESMIVTDFVEGEFVDGVAPPRESLRCVAEGIAAISTISTSGLDIGEVGFISENALIEFRRAIGLSAMQDSVFSRFRNEIERLNQLIYVPDKLVLAHNDLNWGNVMLARTTTGDLRPIFIDWGRCARNVIGADLLYYVPGGLRNYSEDFFEFVSARYVEAMAREGQSISQQDATIGAYYAALQWSTERAVRSKQTRDVQFALSLCERLRSLCL